METFSESVRADILTSVPETEEYARVYSCRRGTRLFVPKTDISNIGPALGGLGRLTLIVYTHIQFQLRLNIARFT